MTNPAPPKSLAVAYLLCVTVGVFGVHYFYLGVTRRAILYLLTFGCLTIGVWIDLFTLPSEVRRVNGLNVSGEPPQPAPGW